MSIMAEPTDQETATRRARVSLFARLSQIQNKEMWQMRKDEMLDLIRNGAPVNASRDGNSMISLAVKFDDSAMAQKVLEHGARVDLKVCKYMHHHYCDETLSHPQYTLFFMAKSRKMAELLFAYKTPYTHTAWGDTPLTLAARNPDIENDMVEFYLDNFKEDPFESNGAFIRLCFSVSKYLKAQKRDLFLEKLRQLRNIEHLKSPTEIKKTQEKLQENLELIKDDMDQETKSLMLYALKLVSILSLAVVDLEKQLR